MKGVSFMRGLMEEVITGTQRASSGFSEKIVDDPADAVEAVFAVTLDVTIPSVVAVKLREYARWDILCTSYAKY